MCREREKFLFGWRKVTLRAIKCSQIIPPLSYKYPNIDSQNCWGIVDETLVSFLWNTHLWSGKIPTQIPLWTVEFKVSWCKPIPNRVSILPGCLQHFAPHQHSAPLARNGCSPHLGLDLYLIFLKGFWNIGQRKTKILSSFFLAWKK